MMQQHVFWYRHSTRHSWMYCSNFLDCNSFLSHVNFHFLHKKYVLYSSAGAFGNFRSAGWRRFKLVFGLFSTCIRTLLVMKLTACNAKGLWGSSGRGSFHVTRQNATVVSEPDLLYSSVKCHHTYKYSSRAAHL